MDPHKIAAIFIAICFLAMVIHTIASYSRRALSLRERIERLRREKNASERKERRAAR